MLIKRMSFVRVVLPVILLVVFAFASLSLAKIPSSRISNASLSVMRVNIYIEKENNHDAAGVKRQVVMQAQREAFQILIERLGSSSEVPNDGVLVSFVNDYEIVDEQNYPIRYEAIFNVRFRPEVLEYINQKKGGGSYPQN